MKTDIDAAPGATAATAATETAAAGAGETAAATVTATAADASIASNTDVSALSGRGSAAPDASAATASTTAGAGVGLTAFSRVLTDPVTGSTLALDRTRYRPSEEMQRWVQLRDGVCMFPNCTRPAMRCQLDHIQEWHRDKGATNAVNLMCLCIGHHALKTLTEWNPVAIGGGVIEWTSPAGRVYRKDPQHRMEPVSGLDVTGTEITAPATDVECPGRIGVDLGGAVDAANGFAATPITEIDLAAPLTRVTVGAGRPLRLFSDASADAHAAWLASLDWAGADPNHENYDEGDPSDEGYARPLGWEPNLGDPPPDPPIDAYFPGGIPGSVLIAMLQRGMSEQQIRARGNRIDDGLVDGTSFECEEPGHEQPGHE